MKIIFCEDPGLDDEPDSMYIDEIAAATRVGMDYMLINYEAIADHNNPARAVRDIPVHEMPERAIYRGWPLPADRYEALYDALVSRGVTLITSPTQYRHCQHLPNILDIIKPMTPRTVWMESDGNVAYEAVMQMLIPFAGRPLVLRDFVKAEKFYWNQACYISSASDAKAVENTIEHFLSLRGADLTGGLIFREFVEFKPLTNHPTGGRPLINEYRIFYLNGAPVLPVRYWDVDDFDHQTNSPPLGQFAEIARQIRSPFFTMDVAQTVDDDWLIIDTGDAQIATLPETADENLLYRAFTGIGL